MGKLEIIFGTLVLCGFSLLLGAKPCTVDFQIAKDNASLHFKSSTLLLLLCPPSPYLLVRSKASVYIEFRFPQIHIRLT